MTITIWRLVRTGKYLSWRTGKYLFAHRKVPIGVHAKYLSGRHIYSSLLGASWR